MPRPMHAFAALMAFVALTAGLSAADTVSRRDAERLQTKLDRIASRPQGLRATEMRTAITETELNSYLRLEMGQSLPNGVSEPWVTFLDNSRVSGRAIVDLERVARGRKSASMLDPFNYLTGKLPITIDGTLRTRNGSGTFVLESATISAVPVPVWMVQEIVSYYSKSPTTPGGVTLDKPFVLPSGIREIQLAKGQAIVVQ